MADIDLETADRMIEAGLAKAKELGIRIAFAITDSAGALISLKRMDGAGPYTTALAENQAYTACIWRRNGEDLARIADRPWFMAEVVRSGGRMVATAGALLVQADGKLLGATGVSGGTGEQDKQCALAALEALKTAAA